MTISASSLALPAPTYVAASGRPRRWTSASSTSEPAVSARRDELAQRVLRHGEGAVGPDAHEDDPLESQGPVLNLADVLKLGRQPGHPPQRVPLLEIQLAVVGLGAGVSHIWSS